MARRILGILLIAMAAGQASNIPAFVDILRDYRVGGTAVAAALAVVLLAGEAGAGFGLLRGGPRRRAHAATIAVGVAALWSALAVQAFVRGIALHNCGCFGVHLGQELRWWVLVEDVMFLALALWVRRSQQHNTALDAGTRRAAGRP